MKIAITSSDGLLGKWLVKYGLTPLGCDITKPDEVKEAINTVLPDVLIHNAALTDVKYCEEHPTEAFNVNVRGTSNILDYFTKGTFIYLSTSHVFSGLPSKLYKETDEISPVNVYGWTKYGGEAMCSTATCQSIIVRISKLFDEEYLQDGISKILNGECLVEPTFIKRTFVYIPHFIDGLMRLVDLKETAPNTINISGTKNLSYDEFWSYVAIELRHPEAVAERSSDNQSSPRPFNGGLDVSLARNMGIPLYSALDGIKEMNKQL